MENVASSARETYKNEPKIVICYFSTYITYNNSVPTTNRDMLLREKILFPDESFGVFDSHSSAPGRGQWPPVVHSAHGTYEDEPKVAYHSFGPKKAATKKKFRCIRCSFRFEFKCIL